MTFVSPSGLEFIQAESGDYILASLAAVQGGQNLNTSVQQQAPVFSMATSVEKLEELDPNGDWNIYYEQMEQYFHANYIDEARKVSTLISSIGQET